MSQDKPRGPGGGAVGLSEAGRPASIAAAAFEVEACRASSHSSAPAAAAEEAASAAEAGAAAEVAEAAGGGDGVDGEEAGTVVSKSSSSSGDQLPPDYDPFRNFSFTDFGALSQVSFPLPLCGCV